MGFRYRKSIKIIPGVKLNISKTGFSTSIGGKGASINISSRGTRVTGGIPGTGISYSQYLSKPKRARRKASIQVPVQEVIQQPVQEVQRVERRPGRVIFWAFVIFLFLMYLVAPK